MVACGEGQAYASAFFAPALSLSAAGLSFDGEREADLLFFLGSPPLLLPASLCMRRPSDRSTQGVEEGG